MVSIKGQSTFFIVGVLLAIVSLVVLVGVYNQFSDSSEISNVNEKLCTAKINALSEEAKDGGIQDDMINVIGLNPTDFLKVCPTQNIIIDPKNLDCDQNVININPYQTQKNCVIDEILDLSRKCWEMNSEGSINGYNWACYTVSIGSIEKIDPNDLIRSRLKTYFNCNSQDSNSNCKNLEKDSFVSAQISSIYNSIIIASKESDINLLKSCSLNEAKFNDKPLIDTTNGFVYDSELYESLYEYLLTNDFQILDAIINESSSENCDLNLIKSNIKNNIQSNNNFISKKEKQNDIIFENYCSSLKEKECDIQKRFNLNLEFSNNFDERILFEDIKLVSNYKMYNEYLSFSDIFRINDPEIEDKLVLFNNDPISPSSAFQINYCDGLSSVTAGLIPMYMCGNKKHISISSELNNAGSRFRQENIEGSCPIFSTLSVLDRSTVDSGVLSTLESVCEGSTII